MTTKIIKGQIMAKKQQDNSTSQPTRGPKIDIATPAY
jgi:hypothetical protein